MTTLLRILGHIFHPDHVPYADNIAGLLRRNYHLNARLGQYVLCVSRPSATNLHWQSNR